MATLRGTRKGTPRATRTALLLRASAPVLALTVIHGSPLHAALFTALILAGYVLLVLVFPTRLCPACWGRKAIRKGRRMVPCTRCRMTGRVKRFGAATIHRVFWRVLGDALIERRKAKRAELRKQRQATGVD